MSYCKYCSHELIEGAKFCSYCGKPIIESERQKVYDGVIHKCPSCGEVLDSFVAFCPSCGYELRDVKGVSVVGELALKLEKTYSHEQKIDLIRNFHIPNTKEDIHEFFILATSNIIANDYDVDAWKAKLEQAYQKAKLTFGEGEELEELTNLYTKAKKERVIRSCLDTCKTTVMIIRNSRLVQSILLFCFSFILREIGLNNPFGIDLFVPGVIGMMGAVLLFMTALFIH